MKKRGKLIVIEGTDGSGKNTQTKELFERLICEGIDCERISFPRYETPTGRIVGECYLGKPTVTGKPGKSWFEKPGKLDALAASLYYAADRREAVPRMLEVLNSGRHLISDRYVESNMGHQGGKERDKSRRLELFKRLDDLEYGILQIPKPDAVVFLYMPWQVAKQLRADRGKHQDAHESSDEHLKNAEEAYLQLSKLRNWIRIDCAPRGHPHPPRTKEGIAEEVYERVSPLLL